MNNFGRWFEYNDNKTDLNNVFSFIEGLPQKFERLISANNSNFKELISRAEIEQLNSELFDSALNEAKMVLESALQTKKRKYKIDSLLEEEKAEAEHTKFKYTDELRQIGFTGDSLKLKVITLNYLWSRVMNRIKELGHNIIDFSNNKIIKLLRKFLTYLNSLLGSLIKFLPGIEPLKEFKEVLEAYLGVGEELSGFN